MFDFFFAVFLFLCYSFICCVTLFGPMECTIVSVMARGQHFLRFYWLGLERCIACRICEFVCPSVALDIRGF